MALTITHSTAATFNTNSGAHTLALTPALGDLIIIVVAATGVASGLGATDNNADGHGTYTQVVSSVKNTSADSIAIFVRADLIRRAAACSFFTTGEGASTGGGLDVFRVSGCQFAGLAAIRQSGAQNNGAAAATPTVPLSVGAALTGNALIGAVFNATSPATMTPPTSWTEDTDVGYSTPTTGVETAHIASGFTGSSVAWGSTSASAFSAVACEISAAAAGHMGEQQEEHSDPFALQVMDRVSPMRGAFFMRKWQRSRSGRLLVPRYA